STSAERSGRGVSWRRGLLRRETHAREIDRPDTREWRSASRHRPRSPDRPAPFRAPRSAAATRPAPPPRAAPPVEPPRETPSDHPCRLSLWCRSSSVSLPRLTDTDQWSAVKITARPSLAALAKNFGRPLKLLYM